MNKNQNKLSQIFLFLIFACAILLRAKVYLATHSLWLDECSLAMSVLDNKFLGVLEYGQAAPSGFLILSKLVTIVAGVSELSIRFLPFLSSILSIFAFYYLSKSFLKRTHSIVFVNFLFAVNYYLIYYSQEFKQYSSDVLVAILVLLMLKKINFEKISAKKLLGLGVLFSVLFWFSFISVFVFASAFILVLFKNFKDYKKILALFCPFILNMVLFYIFHMKDTLGYQSNFSFWQDGFINANFSNFLRIIVENINYFFEPNKFALFALILIVAGSVLMCKGSRKNALLLVFPIFALIVASYLHVYPFQQRVVLFLIPILIILMSKSLDVCSLSKKASSVLIIFITAVYFSGYFSAQYYESIGSEKFFKTTDARALTKEISMRSSKNDMIVLAPSSSSPFEFYSKIYPVKYSRKFVEQMPEYDKVKYLNSLDTLPSGNYWFYIAHDVSHAPVRSFIEEWTQSKCKNVKEYTKGESYLIYAQKK